MRYTREQACLAWLAQGMLGSRRLKKLLDEYGSAEAAYDAFQRDHGASLQNRISDYSLSLLRNVIPAKVHLPCYIVIIAGFVTIVQMVMHAYMDSLYTALGVFLPLIVVNCIILGRAEMFACKNNVVDSALDGVGMGIGYTLTVVLMATIREVLGSGTWLGFQILPDSVARIGIMTQAPGAFFCYGILMAGCVWLEGKLDARIERKSCCDIDNLKKEAE